MHNKITKGKSKKQNKCNKNANEQVNFSHLFFPFCLSFVSPFIVLPFFSFEVLLFDFPFVFLLIIRISYGGEHNDLGKL